MKHYNFHFSWEIFLRFARTTPMGKNSIHGYKGYVLIFFITSSYSTITPLGEDFGSSSLVNISLCEHSLLNFCLGGNRTPPPQCNLPSWARELAFARTRRHPVPLLTFSGLPPHFFGQVFGRALAFVKETCRGLGLGSLVHRIQVQCSLNFRLPPR